MSVVLERGGGLWVGRHRSNLGHGTRLRWFPPVHPDFRYEDGYAANSRASLATCLLSATQREEARRSLSKLLIMEIRTCLIWYARSDLDFAAVFFGKCVADVGRAVETDVANQGRPVQVNP